MRSSIPVVVVAALAMLFAACSGESSPPPKPNGVDYHFEFEMAAATETYWCEYVKLPDNGKPANATGFKWNTDSFHHWALFRTSGLDASAVDGKKFECFGSPETKAAQPASIVSQPTTNISELIYPEPYAIPFKSGEILMLQAHTVNASAQPIMPSLDLTVLLADDGAKVSPLGEFQFYNPYVVVPPNGVGHASMRCQIPFDVDFVYQTTHAHTRMKDFRVFLDPPGGPEASVPMLHTSNWEEPASKLGVQHIPAGSAFRIYADYADTKGVETLQGPDRDTNEMEQFYGFYSPPLPDPATAVFFEACVPSFAPGGTGDMYGTGASSCADTLACIAACAPADAPAIGDGRFLVGACWQKCMVASCPSASTDFNKVFGCVSAKCPAECAKGFVDPACQSCAGTNCAAEIGACQTAICAP